MSQTKEVKEYYESLGTLRGSCKSGFIESKYSVPLHFAVKCNTLAEQRAALYVFWKEKIYWVMFTGKRPKSYEEEAIEYADGKSVLYVGKDVVDTTGEVSEYLCLFSTSYGQFETLYEGDIEAISCEEFLKEKGHDYNRLVTLAVI